MNTHTFTIEKIERGYNIVSHISMDEIKSDMVIAWFLSSFEANEYAKERNDNMAE